MTQLHDGDGLLDFSSVSLSERMKAWWLGGWRESAQREDTRGYRAVIEEYLKISPICREQRT